MKKIILTIFLFFLMNLNVFANDLTLEQKIGQMIIIGFEGNSIQSKEYLETLKKLRSGQIGGVILFKKNIKSKEDLLKMNSNFISNCEITPFISIDNEGGHVQRHNFLNSKSASAVSKMSEKQAKIEYQKMADLLSELKINFNFAPVGDLGINQNSIIVKKQRSYGKNPNEVIKYSKIMIDEHSKKKILTSLKHFPGHGSVLGDTHKDFVDATNTFKDIELEPYRALINKNNYMTIMVSHIYNSNFDKDYPASLSSETIKGLLREKMGYSGLIVSDDFDMDAIRKNYSLEEIVINAINSGINVMIFSNNLNYYDKNIDKKIRKIIIDNLKTGQINMKDIDSSVDIILKTKKLIK